MNDKDLGVAVMFIASVIIGVMACSYHPSHSYTGWNSRQMDDAEHLFGYILNGTAKPDGQGLFDAARYSPSVSGDEPVTVTHGRNGLVMIFFSTHREQFGEGGYLFYNRWPSGTLVPWPYQHTPLLGAV